MIYLQLFISFLQVGLFSVGGGYAAIPLIQSQVVTAHQWMTMSEFTDLVTIAEMTPGPIAVNSATFVGIRIAGIGGAVIATIGCILPSLILVSVLAYIYFKYKEMPALQYILSSLRPAVVALIASAGLSVLKLVMFSDSRIGISNMNWMGLGIFLAALAVLRKLKWNPVLVMGLCGAAGLVLNLAVGM